MAMKASVKHTSVNRLRRIEGQVRGLQRMIDDGRHCDHIAQQIASVHEALRAVGREVIRSHFKHRAASLAHDGAGESEQMHDELIEMMYRLGRW